MMKFLKILLIGSMCALVNLLTGLPVMGAAVGFAALFGPSPAMLTGAVAGALFPGLPMGLGFISSALLATAGLAAGRVRLRRLSLFAACSLIIIVQTLIEASLSAFAANGLSLDLAARTGVVLALSVFFTALAQPLFWRMRDERYA